MGKKYLDTKEGSLEQSILGLWQEAAGTKKEKLDPVGKEDGDIDNDGDKDSSDKYLAKRRKTVAKAIKKDKNEGNAFGKALKDAKDKGEKTFVVSGKTYEVKEEEVKEDVELNEASVMVDLENDDKKLMSDIKKMGIKVKDLGDSGNPGYNEYKLTGSPAALKKGGKKFGWDQQLEKVQVKEGKMSQMHQLIKDKKSAEEISKIMRLDLKSVKALMANYMSAGYHESYDIGTDKYRKHTEDVTPGEDGDWVAAQKGKNDSMRETLAKVWGFDEGKSPFKKESKKDLTKEVKDGKTMTGKKVASVEMNPTIKEKKK
jgi:hypothetical protein